MRVGSTIDGVPLRVTKISRAELGDVDALSRVLASEGGWYCDFRTDSETFVVFANRVFCYPRGDPAGRAEAAAYARSVGVPEPQLESAQPSGTRAATGPASTSIKAFRS
jgi:hypothetical protein